MADAAPIGGVPTAEPEHLLQLVLRIEDVCSEALSGREVEQCLAGGPEQERMGAGDGAHGVIPFRSGE